MHHRHAGELGSQPGALEVRSHLIADRPDRRAQFVRCRGRRFEGKHHQGQFAVVRQHLAADDLVRRHPLDQRLVVGTLRQRIRKERRGNGPVVGRLARREYGDQPARAVDQLEFDSELAQLFQRCTLKEAIALDDDEDVEFVRWESPRDLLVGPEFLGLGLEQLTERIVDLDPHETHGRDHAQYNEGNRAQCLVRQREKTDALNPQRKVARLNGPRGALQIAVRW